MSALRAGSTEHSVFNGSGGFWAARGLLPDLLLSISLADVGLRFRSAGPVLGTVLGCSWTDLQPLLIYS